jgi:hypothetical protein
MTKRGYTMFGWIVWQIASRLAKRKTGQNKLKVGAAASLALVLVAGFVAAKATGDDD